MRHRWSKKLLSIMLVMVMMLGILPTGAIAHAQGHTHTEDCYAESGELICEEDTTNGSDKNATNTDVDDVEDKTETDELSDSNTLQRTPLGAECTVSNVDGLKQALLDGKSEIGISGQIELSEEITVEHAVSFIGITDGDGFARDDGYDGTLFNIAGTDSASIAVTFSNITLDGKSVESAKSAVCAAYTTLTIEDSVFENCTAVTTGGIYPNRGSVVNGAAINVRNSAVNITDTKFTANSINTGTGWFGDYCNGASLYMVDCDAEISGCEFTDNKLTGRRGKYGIAAYAQNGVFTFKDTNFLNNGSYENEDDDRAYGTLYVSERNPADGAKADTGMLRLNMDNCVFNGNRTYQSAAAVCTPYDGFDYYNNRYIDIKNSEFTDNYADMEAGALLLCGSHITIDNTKVLRNEGVGQAGGVLFYTSDATISNSEFSDNSSTDGCSGAIHVWDSVVEMTDVDICNNTAKYEGGAMCIYAPDYYTVDADGNCYTNSKVTFNSGNISFNKTVGPRSVTENSTYQSNGGGVFVHTGATFILNGGTMEGNSSSIKGGAVCVDDQDYIDTDDVWGTTHSYDRAGRFYMNGGMIRDNYAAVAGGGVYVSDAAGMDSIEMSHRDSAHFVMDGGIIRDNTAGENGGGVFVQYSETPCVFTMSDGALVFDNKANNDQSFAGDDIFDETDTASAQKTVNANYPYREYSDILAENCIVTPIAGQAIPDELKIPFVNWYIDEAADASGNAHRFVDLTSPVPDNGKLNVTNGLKAIWGGYLLLYDANDGSGRTEYQEKAFYPGENASIKDNMFPVISGKEFIGWNTEADGSGVSYSKDSVLPMNGNLILYAQYRAGSLHTGSLTVSKTVTGTGTPDADTLFEFTVTKAGVAASGKYSIDGSTAQAIPADGKISFKAGQSVLLTGLEAGGYMIAETSPAQANYQSTTFSVNGGTVQSGCKATITVTSADTESVAFTNNYKEGDTPTPPTPSDTTGNLTVSKMVAGDAGDTNKAFSFTVKLKNSTISGNYGEMTFANGTATFTLKHNEQKTATGLPAGTSYEVTESEANQNGYTTTATGANGIIAKDQTATAAFTNTMKRNDGYDGGDSDDSGYGSMTVRKTVSGTAGDTTKAFTFTIKLDRTISGKYGDMTFDKGIATIKLQHGESSTAKGLPSGIHYSVTESDNEGYTVRAVGAIGIIGNGKTVVADFTNNRDVTPVTPDSPDTPVNPDTPNTPDRSDNSNTLDHAPKTDDTMNLAFWLSLMGLSLAGLFASLAAMKKNSYRGRRMK